MLRIDQLVRFLVELIYPPTGTTLSVIGDVPVDSETTMMISSISRIYRHGLAEVLIGVIVRASTVFRKKKL